MKTDSPALPCPECGAPLAPGRSCREYFHELLALEAAVPGGAGEEPHFLAVATYNLQHPAAFILEILVGLRTAVADVLSGRATVADARRRARWAAEGARPVLRRSGEERATDGPELPPAWPTRWRMTVHDVCRMPPERYVEEVRRWATSVAEDLAAAPASIDS